MKKIILIYPHFITIRDWHRFGMEYLLDMGYDVEVWRVWDGFMPKVKLNLGIGMYTGDNMHDFSLLEFESKVNNNKNAIFILMYYQNYIYVRAMARYKCKYVLFDGTGRMLKDYTVPMRRHSGEKKKKNVFIDRLRQQYVQGLLNVGLKYFRSHLPRHVFLGTDVNDDWLKHVPKARKTYIHSFDYDRYLEEKDKEIEEKHIVYIDQGYGNLHSDTHMLGIVYPWSDKKAHGKLAMIFDKLEEHYRLPVVVAGHPHVKYDSEFLYNRKIIFNKTPELIANSKFVIMQWSTAISLVLLFKKDVLALFDNDFKKFNEWRNYYNANYKYFGVTPCNMDIPKMAAAPWEYVHKIDEKTAREYINEYVKMPGTPDRLFIEVVEEKIREM